MTQFFNPYLLLVVIEADNLPPVFTNCPSDITQTIALGDFTSEVTWTEPTVTDNTGTQPTVFQNYSPGDSFRVGETRVDYFALDQAGNEALCSFTVTGNLLFAVFLHEC